VIDLSIEVKYASIVALSSLGASSAFRRATPLRVSARPPSRIVAMRSGPDPLGSASIWSE